jgi:hypothetical protein
LAIYHPLTLVFLVGNSLKSVKCPICQLYGQVAFVGSVSLPTRRFVLPVVGYPYPMTSRRSLLRFAAVRFGGEEKLRHGEVIVSEPSPSREIASGKESLLAIGAVVAGRGQAYT